MTPEITITIHVVTPDGERHDCGSVRFARDAAPLLRMHNIVLSVAYYRLRTHYAGLGIARASEQAAEDIADMAGATMRGVQCRVSRARDAIRDALRTDAGNIPTKSNTQPK